MFRIKQILGAGIFDHINKKEIIGFAGKRENIKCLFNSKSMDLTLNSCQSIELMNFLNLLKTCLVLVMISLIVLILENLFINFNKIFVSAIGENFKKFSQSLQIKNM
jgi:hypothetical protein